VAKFRYLGTNQNLIQEEIKRRLNPVNACYHSVQSIFSSHLLSNNIIFRIYKTLILPEIRYLTLSEEHTNKQRVFANRVLRRMFGLKRDEMTRDWRKIHNEELHNLYSSPNIIRMIKSRRTKCVG
jgi:hypothetical protein